ncbi:hypothetical protein OK006_4393 [Actinobacteria bacterium OK006]|nr:hypothetical protein OK006_4393 [Actinobacteria bacterium OK006]
MTEVEAEVVGQVTDGSRAAVAARGGVAVPVDRRTGHGVEEGLAPLLVNPPEAALISSGPANTPRGPNPYPAPRAPPRSSVPRLKPLVPERVLLAWPEFLLDGDWVPIAELTRSPPARGGDG